MPDTQTPLQGQIIRVENTVLDGQSLFRLTNATTGEPITSVQRLSLHVLNPHTLTPGVYAELVIDGVIYTLHDPHVQLDLSLIGEGA